jgi:hypothetical protein
VKESSNEGLEIGSGVLLIDKGKSLSLVLAGLDKKYFTHRWINIGL